MKILISENAGLILGNATEMVRGKGEAISLNYFGSARQGVMVLERDPQIDMVILDTSVIDGEKIDIIGYIKQSSRLTAIPIVIVSAKLDGNRVAEFLRRGISDIIIPPIERDALVERLCQVSNKGKKKILIVDDNEDILEILRTFLQMERYAVLTAVSAEAGLEVLGNNPINAVIADVILPEMNGVVFMRTIKKHYPKLPVIMITGYSGKFTPAEIISAGADGFFIKPFKNRELAQTLQNIMSRYSSSRAIDVALSR
jgi:DNA-binding NtrC family response regulator